MKFSSVEVPVTGTEAVFAIQSLTPILRNPNLFDILKLLNQIYYRNQTKKSYIGPLEYFFVRLHIEDYQMITAISFISPVPTPNIPNFENQRAGKQEQICLNYTAHKAKNNDITNMNDALTTIFLHVISDP